MDLQLYRRWALLAAIVALVWAEPQASAQCSRFEIEKLVASGGQANEGYGRSVALSGGIAVVGAWGSDLAAPNGGAVYVYSFDGQNWIEQTILTASDVVEGTNLGRSVAIDGDVIVAGSIKVDTEIALEAGAAYVFRFDGETWQEEAKLFAADGASYDRFGISVSVSGNTVVVGSYGDDDNGNWSGSAYIFRFDGETWSQETKLMSPDGASYDYFGFATSISQDVVVVSAFGDDGKFGGIWDEEFGSAYVFRFDGVHWVQETKLFQTDELGFAWFGYALSVSGDLLVVGAPFVSTDLLPGGAAYAYRFDGTNWLEIATLDPFDVDEFDNFGTSVSVRDDIVIVGSDFGNPGCMYGELLGAGTAYMFKFDESGCLGQTKLGASDPAHLGRFGSSVAVDDGMAIVARLKDESVAPNTGSVYVFDDLGPDEGCACDELTLYVDDDAAPGGDGLSWNSALTNLQDALVASSLNTEIRVAQGVYTPDGGPCEEAGDRFATFDVSRVGHVRGGYAGVSSPDPDDRDTKRYQTILSGDLNGDDGPDFSNNSDNAHHVLLLYNSNHAPVLEGLVITAGNAVDAPSFRLGAGARVQSDVTFIDCVFVGNAAANGAGISFLPDGTSASMTLENCVFRGNLATSKGGAVYNYFAVGEESRLIAKDCVFMQNEADEGGAIFQRAWLLSPHIETILVNCLLTGNTAKSRGGAIHNFADVGSTVNLIALNCTFADNVAGDAGGGIYNTEFIGEVEMLASNSIFWNNAPDQIASDISSSITVEINYSDVEGGWTGDGTNNLDADPLFVASGIGDYRLLSGSPCIDAADNAAVPDGIETDLDGNPRFVDDPKTEDTGNGDPPIVDMGPYEFQRLACPWDLDDNEVVSVSDLLALLATWGSCKGCPADFDGDGNVGVKDLLVLLGNWGSCP